MPPLLFPNNLDVMARGVAGTDFGVSGERAVMPNPIHRLDNPYRRDGSNATSAPQGSQHRTTGSFGAIWHKFFEAVYRRLKAAETVTPVTTADASDLATAIALANALKTKVNEYQAAMQK